MFSQVISTLRVNVKSLAAESRIIRAQEKSTKDPSIRSSLHEHRVRSLREEARHAQLALACVKNRDYLVIERNAKVEPDWKKIKEKINRHTKDEEVLNQVNTWCAKSKEEWCSRGV